MFWCTIESPSDDEEGGKQHTLCNHEGRHVLQARGRMPNSKPFCNLHGSNDGRQTNLVVSGRPQESPLGESGDFLDRVVIRQESLCR